MSSITKKIDYNDQILTLNEKTPPTKETKVSWCATAITIGTIAVGVTALSCYWLSSQEADNQENPSQITTTSQDIARIAGDCILTSTMMIQNFVMFGAAYRIHQEQQINQLPSADNLELSDDLESPDYMKNFYSDLDSTLEHLENTPPPLNENPAPPFLNFDDDEAPTLTGENTQLLTDKISDDLELSDYTKNFFSDFDSTLEHLENAPPPVDQNPDTSLLNFDDDEAPTLTGENTQLLTDKISDCISAKSCSDLDFITIFKGKKWPLEQFSSHEFDAVLGELKKRGEKLNDLLYYRLPKYLDNPKGEYFSLPKLLKESLEILRFRKDDPREKALYVVSEVSSLYSKLMLNPSGKSGVGNHLIPALLEKYDLRYQYASNYESLCQAIESAVKTGPLAAIYIDGHGSSESIELGDDSDERIYVFDHFPDCFSNLKKDGKIVLISCETGNYFSSPRYSNLAIRMSRMLDRIVIAPTESIYGSKIHLLPDGSVYHPEKNDPTKNTFHRFYPDDRIEREPSHDV